MDTNKYMMTIEARARGVICSVCRQRLSMTTNDTKIHCPACNNMNQIPTYERYSKEDGDIRCRRIGKIAAKVKNKISHHRNGNKKPESLNCNPSPLASDSSHSSPVVRPRKRALLIGVTYKKWKHKLKGTVNDVTSMKDFLINNCGFLKENILVLADQEPKPELIPTKKNIQNSLEWLVTGCQAGDSLVFYFSGHGLRQPDFDGDEIDGYDETICPIDFVEEGMISDNVINSTIVRPLPEGVTLHAIVDACHSGTMLDLLHVYNRDKKKWEDNSPPSGNVSKDTKGGLAISISACEDNQVAADTSAFTGKDMSGALTYMLIEILKSQPKVTYGELIDKMHESLEGVNLNGCLPARILRRVLHNRLLQKPQLSASQIFDVYGKHFVL